MSPALGSADTPVPGVGQHHPTGGDLGLVLHAHLPFVRHPEHAYHLEENWLYEAITATYLPLLEVLAEARARGQTRCLTVSLSPPLCAMLRDDLLQRRYAAYLDRLLRLGEQEVRRTSSTPEERALARFHLDRFGELRQLLQSIAGDVVGAFAALQAAGTIDVITTAATHGYLPVLREEMARRAQINVAVRAYREWFGRHPRGMWLPECGYVDGIDELLAEQGIRYFFMDAHGILYGHPRPPLGLHAPVFTARGVAAFGRDLDSSRQVWSATEGYPGDGVYRDFYRDVGYDRPLDEIAPYIHPDKIRVHTGYKYHRVTGPRVDLADKALYDPALGLSRADEHAADFVAKRTAQAAHLALHMDRRPFILSPYDAELFGHWWFEGPAFLRGVLRRLDRGPDALRLNTAEGYLQTYSINAVSQPAQSSWGEGGYSAVWLDASNDWMYRHVHRAETQAKQLVERFVLERDPLIQRALRQLLRELLLAQSSDWAFILKTGTAVGYATQRFKTHIAQFQALAKQLSEGTIDAGWLAEVEARDNLFPTLDPSCCWMGAGV